MELESKKIFLINTTFIATVLLVIYFVSKFMLGFLTPFIFALFFSYLGAKTATHIFKKTKLNEKWIRICVLLALYLLFVLLFAVLLFGIIKYSGKFLSDLQTFSKSLESIFYTVNQKINAITYRLPENLKQPAKIAIENFSTKILTFIADAVSNATMSFAKFLPRFFVSATVTLVASFYIVKDYDRLINFLKLMIGDKKYFAALKIKNIVTGSVLKLFLGYLILSAITFVAALIAFLIFSFKNAVIFAFIIALIDLLPVLGAGTVLIPACILNFLIGDTYTAIILLLIYISLTLLKNFLEPKIISAGLDINPLLLLMTLFIGLKIGGITGMLLLPIATIVTITYYKTD